MMEKCGSKKLFENPNTSYKICMQKGGLLYHFALKVQHFQEYNNEGKDYFIVSLMDITKEISMSENIKNIINFQNNMLIIMDENLNLIYANNKFLDMFDVKNTKELSTKFKNINDIFLKDSEFFYSKDSKRWIHELSKLEETKELYLYLMKLL